MLQELPFASGFFFKKKSFACCSLLFHTYFLFFDMQRSTVCNRELKQSDVPTEFHFTHSFLLSQPCELILGLPVGCSQSNVQPGPEKI